MSNKKSIFLQLLSCTISFVIMGFLFISSVNAYIIYNFPADSFWVIDRTTPNFTFAVYPQDTIIGYISNYENYPNRYQLTDTVSSMTVGM